ncbi:hypothetical protein ACT009_07980 [Sphingomonas sp. Tas61C01]|uniref:hypothetical protein n=1 Tax=Sphingomonas sp. Tas61C01 TaxID=3458297 RepID=UPI00403E9F0D
MPTDDDSARECLAHLRAAADWCEAAGMVSAWATVLGVADIIRERLDEAASR